MLLVKWIALGIVVLLFSGMVCILVGRIIQFSGSMNGKLVSEEYVTGEGKTGRQRPKT